MDLGLYIHVPFCVKKCPYCDFYSVRYEKELAERYISALMRNFAAYRERCKEHTVTSVYFGGGTPSLLSPEMISRLLSFVGESFSLSPDAEITMEANPSLSGKDRLSLYRKSGVNRISFGVQSFSDEELSFLGRLHNAEGARKAVLNAYSAGFDNISADIMLGIKGQTLSSLKDTINTAAELPLSHISAYMLKIESGTPFDCDEMRSAVASDDDSAELYLAAVKELERSGFIQYEISNFAKEGRKSRHNLLYWKCGEYVGFGAAAHSCFGGTRYAVPCDIRLFLDSDVQTEEVTEDNPCDFEEYAMLRLRLTEGLSLSDCERKYDVEIKSILQKAEPLEKSGLLRICDNDIITLTPSGFLVSNGVIERLVI